MCIRFFSLMIHSEYEGIKVQLGRKIKMVIIAEVNKFKIQSLADSKGDATR